MKAKELSTAIDKVRPALLDGRMITWAGQLIFQDDFLVTLGDAINIVVPLQSGISVAIRAEEFMKLVQKLSADKEVTLRVSKDSKNLHVVSGNTKAKFPTIDFDSEDPVLTRHKISDIEWQPAPPGFAAILGFCVFSAADQAANMALTCLNVTGSRIISADNYRVTERLLPEGLNMEGELLIPKKIARYLSKFALNEVGLSNYGVHYRDENGVIFTHNIVEDSYPIEAVNSVLDVEGESLTLPTELSIVVDRVGVASVKDSDDIREVKVTISEKGDIGVDGVGPYAEITDTCESKAEYSGKQLSFTVSADHLMQILAYSTTVKVGEEMLLFHGEGFRSVVCLL